MVLLIVLSIVLWISNILSHRDNTMILNRRIEMDMTLPHRVIVSSEMQMPIGYTEELDWLMRLACVRLVRLT